MSETSTVPAADDLKLCKVCAEPIKKTARVCIHCNNYQDWRAELNVSSTVLSLLVALVSVLTAAVPALMTATTPRDSHLSFSDQGTTENLISLLVTNSGTRPGTVRYPIFLSTEEGPYKDPPIELFLNGVRGSAIIIEPGKSDLLELLTRSGKADPVEKDRVDRTVAHMLEIKAHPGPVPSCVVSLFKNEFQGRGTQESVPISCNHVDTFVMNLQQDMK
jgi:hypothetical protein